MTQVSTDQPELQQAWPVQGRIPSPNHAVVCQVARSPASRGFWVRQPGTIRTCPGPHGAQSH